MGLKNLFTGGININKVAGNLLDKLDDSSLTQAEKADGVVSMMERLGITPSSKTRRQVTWFLLSFISTTFVFVGIAYKYNQDYGDKLFELLKEYTSNSVILAIVAFFYGGYYLTKNVSPTIKAKIERKNAELRMKEKEFDQDLRVKEAEAQIDIETKAARRKRRFLKN